MRKDHHNFLQRMAANPRWEGWTWRIRDEEAEYVGPWPVNSDAQELQEIYRELEATESSSLLLEDSDGAYHGFIQVLPYESSDQLANWSLKLPQDCQDTLDSVVLGY